MLLYASTTKVQIPFKYIYRSNQKIRSEFMCSVLITNFHLLVHFTEVLNFDT